MQIPPRFALLSFPNGGEGLKGSVFVVDANNAAFFWMPAKAGIQAAYGCGARRKNLGIRNPGPLSGANLRGKHRTMLAAAAMTALLCAGYGKETATAAEAVSLPPATLLAPDTDQVTATIRSLEEKVRQNPDDFVAYTKLAGYYLQRQRETGSTEYLTLAERAARASLAILPPEQNYSGLAALAQTEYALHNFAAARDHATRLTELSSTKSAGWEILSDALLELGEYESALRALDRLQHLAGETVGTQTRLARSALLRGHPEDAARYLSRAVVLALEQSPPQRETVAWCRWQLGEMAFASR